MTTLRTRNQTLTHILTELNDGRLGAMNEIRCVYENDEGKHCVVGCLFTPEQHQWIKDNGASNDSLTTLLCRTGAPAIADFAGGLTKKNLEDLQDLHDRWAKSQPFRRDEPACRLAFLKAIIDLIE